VEQFLFVLHCFEKKAKSRIATPKRDLDVVRRRLREATQEYRELQRNSHAQKKS